ncbi:serine hydrolase domain-containing protein [Pseudalkalibacillus salsuginis]|uniref:serine hydrolase domain-containing protein n=1 Tax=Pseudalkalibacillus salsuginis TaxID=2910972 RepID=UPI001F17E0DF|nr:serine hydrolase domain-containing protein [Pseudalkalibacillus salsuginis]MCF6410321.1 serine hydrolase [Pseudalkalibacillus salsuginis]
MEKKSLPFALAVLLGGTSLFVSGHVSNAEGQHPINQSIENHENKTSTNQAHPVFSWGEPGPISPVLHPGSAKGAGMREAPLHEIDAIIETMIEEEVMPGAVAFVARRGHIVKEEAYGYAARYTDDNKNEMEAPVTMQEDTIFDLASISKIFTTTAAMKLYEEGAFELDDPVANYIPEFAQKGKDEVTIRQLMTHTSGFTAWIPLYTQGNDREDRLQIVFAHPLKNEPGTTYTYSDLNMITLGALVERLSGKRLDQYVKENITDPLGMEDTMYDPPSSLKGRIAATEYQPWTDRGLVWGKVHDENAWSLDGVAGHAGVFSTAQDLAKLAHMYVNEGRYGDEQILQPETVKLLVENQIPSFPGNDHGLGWEIQQGWFMDALSSESTVGHTGYTGTSVVVDLNNATIAILLTNRVHPTRNTVSTNIARRAFARKFADSIPVSMNDKSPAWFSDYGDRLGRSLSAQVDLEEPATLTFDSWYRIEPDYDFGNIEVSEDGENWTQIHEPLTGSKDWSEIAVRIPAGAKHIRFTYKTDSYTNGRGWYLDNLRLTLQDETVLTPEWSGEGWSQRRF